MSKPEFYVTDVSLLATLADKEAELVALRDQARRFSDERVSYRTGEPLEAQGRRKRRKPLVFGRLPQSPVFISAVLRRLFGPRAGFYSGGEGKKEPSAARSERLAPSSASLAG